MRYDNINPGFAVYDFDSFVPTKENPIPNIRVMDYLTVGPFVLETDGSFESEHMYERDKILLEDYLSADGGEKNIFPILGGKTANRYYGNEYYTWEKGFIKWDSLRFDREEDACDPALYATEQRNAVYYAAFYIDCNKPEKAVIYYVNSGSSLFVNGELVDFKPFGRVKGIADLGYQCTLHLKAGRNLIMFKLRPGYIADTMDISMSVCCVLPVITELNGLAVVSPLPTIAYTGTKDNPRMVFHMFAAAFKKTDETIFSLDGKKYNIPSLKSGEVYPVHAGIKTGKEKSIRKCRAVLASGKNKSSKDFFFETRPYDGYSGTEHIFSDFHFDTTYHQEQRTYALGAFHITKCIVENLIKNPSFKAVLSEIDYLHPYYSLYPGHREALRKAFSDGRAEADCFYNQPNDLTSSGEAFVRNMAYGQLYHRDVMGRISRVYVPGDVFGHFSQMTQVCKKSGCDMIRWSKVVYGLDQLFKHMSPDGTVMIHDKGITRSEAIRFGVSGCAHSSQAVSYVEAYPRNNDTSWMNDTITNARFSVFSDMADDILESYKNNESNGCKGLIELTSRDLTRHHSGVLLTRTDFKQANRLCENLLISAEKFAAVSFCYGAKYPEKALDKAWRQLLCAQHHDSVTGTNNEISFIDLMAEYRESAETAFEVLKNSAEYIAENVKTDSCGTNLFVFNPVASACSDICEFTLPGGFNGKYAIAVDLKGNKHPLRIKGDKAHLLTGTIPATGYSMYRIEHCCENPDIITVGNDLTIENAKFRLTVDKNHGGIISLIDKKEKKELIDISEPASGNSICILHEIHDRMEAQHEFYTTGERLVSDDFTALIRSEKCSEFQKLTITTTLGTIARTIREITLYKNSETIDFKTIVEDYNSEDHMFCATFPVNINGGAVVYDDRFAPHISTRSHKYMSFQTHQFFQYSGCSVLPANRWFGVGPSVTINTKSGAINIGMTAVITKKTDTITESIEKLLAVLTKKGIPVTCYSDTEQHGGTKIIHFNEDVSETDTRFVLCIKDDGNRYAGILISSMNTGCSKKFESVLNRKGVATAYFRDNNNLYNKNIDVFLIMAESNDKLNEYIANLGNSLAVGYIADMNDCIEADMPIVADNYGVSIINNGNISCSVEGKNTLNLMLFHTAGFYGNMGKVTGGKELVPEQKSHIFTYRLYPHKGSFREADVYGQSGRFNEKLFGIIPSGSFDNAFLPENKSFLECTPGFEITAFKASGYPMASMKSENQSPEKRGLCIRGFETTGTDHSVKISTCLGVKNVISTNLLEEDGVSLPSGKTTFKFNAGAHSIETFCFNPTYLHDGNGASLGREKDITEPTYVRSWEHDMGSVATGYLKFAATLDKKSEKIDKTRTIVSLNAVNNASDSIANVTIKIVSSKDIKTDKKSVTVCLAPGESSVTNIITTKKSEGTKGQIKIYYDYDGQTFTDVYEFGYFNPEVNLEIQGNKLVCNVKNPTDQHLDGSLIIATPFETWGNIETNSNSFGTVSPSAYSVTLEPFGSAEYIFSADFDESDFFKAYYAAVKLCCNGRIHFAFAHCHGPRHNYWTHIFYDEIINDNGSINKILNM